MTKITVLMALERSGNSWKQLNREDIRIARCTVEHLMKQLQLVGGRRGKCCVTTVPGDLAHKLRDLVKRQFSADRPNQL